MLGIPVCRTRNEIGGFVVFQPYYHPWLIHAVTSMARPVDKEVPTSYFDFMTSDSVSMFLAVTLYQLSFHFQSVCFIFLYSYFYLIFFLFLCFPNVLSLFT